MSLTKRLNLRVPARRLLSRWPATLFVVSALCVVSSVPAQNVKDLLSLDPQPDGLRLYYALGDAKGIFSLLRSDHLPITTNSGSVVYTGDAAVSQSGMIDLPFPTNGAAFFGLMRVIAVTTPPFAAPPGMIWIPPGTFLMGSPTNESERFVNETQHAVTLTRGFYMSENLATQDQYAEVTRSGGAQGFPYPAASTDWYTIIRPLAPQHQLVMSIAGIVLR